MGASRELRLAAVFVELAHVRAAAVLLTDERGGPGVTAGSDGPHEPPVTAVVRVTAGPLTLTLLPGDADGGDADTALAQALADAAAIAIGRRRALRRAELPAGQLQEALERRVAVEQAKGMLAERWGTGTDEAFEALRRHARAHRIRVAELARTVTEGALDTESLRPPESSPPESSP